MRFYPVFRPSPLQSKGSSSNSVRRGTFPPPPPFSQRLVQSWQPSLQPYRVAEKKTPPSFEIAYDCWVMSFRQSLEGTPIKK
ncbi:hypothetical protein CEXT_328421 [Caerostris extrusa]|uniref:Uncharacterized protein n=1 Tax=Caerostris extrusa TaxID=172846 RepID=A0AAV4U258_CAEEX|nr:hypothetical protein CEXT_328421 [Caerostris extrusa]